MVCPASPPRHTLTLPPHPLSIEPNHTTLAGHEYSHDLMISSKYGFLGSVDANTGDPVCGWDTDQFTTNARDAFMTMLYIVEQGGLAPGGINFDAKVRRESTDLEDYFVAHVGAMDLYARALKAVAAVKADGSMDKWVKERYASFDSGFGKKIESGKATLADCEAHTHAHGEPKLASGKQEQFEYLLSHFGM